MNGQDEKKCVSCCPCRLAVAVGLVWGLALFLVGIVTMHSETYGREFVQVMGSIYKGYAAGSWSGAAWGLLWGFVDGFLCVLIIAAVYAILAKCGGCCCRSRCEPK